MNGVDFFRAIQGKTSGHWGDIKFTVVPDERSSEEILAARRARWREEQIWETPQGFSLLPEGRAGSIYFRRGEKVVELECELSGNPALDIVLSGDNLSQWIDVGTLEYEPVTIEDQIAIRAALVDWLTKRGLKFSIGGVVIARR